MKDFGMLDVFKMAVEANKERLIELDYYDDFEKCFDESCIYPFGKLNDLIDEFRDFEGETDEELGNYLLKNLFACWIAEMKMSIQVIDSKLNRTISKYQENLKKHYNIIKLRKSIDPNDPNKTEFIKYIRSNHYLPGEIPDSDFQAVNELIDLVDMANTERILIEDFTDKLVLLSGYYDNK